MMSIAITKVQQVSATHSDANRNDRLVVEHSQFSLGPEGTGGQESLRVTTENGSTFAVVTDGQNPRALCVVQVDPWGRAQIVEVSSPPVILVREGELVSLPRQRQRIAGRWICFSQLHLEEGDFLVAVTDGVTRAGAKRISPQGWTWECLAGFVCRNADPDYPAAELGWKLERTCRYLSGGRLDNDCAALVMKLRAPRSVTVLIGPPRKASLDAQVAALLKESLGEKVVCGGTTAKVVAREWRVPLRVNTPSCTGKTPPTAYIPGVDLATEGIITVSEALEYVQQGRHFAKEDSASAKLARMLLGADTIHFVVGSAENPAHATSELGGGLAKKLQVVDDLHRSLQGLGKNVTVTRY